MPKGRGIRSLVFDETIIRVCGGWLVMTWQELRVWELQK